MLTKEKIISSIENIPESFTFDDVIDKILFLEKIEKGAKQSNNDEIISDNELE